MAATSRWLNFVKAAWRYMATLGGSALAVGAAGPAHAAPTLPEDRADAMFHLYEGAGLRAMGPALLVRKRLGENLSLSGTYYVDLVSSASIDVVTSASKYKETRQEFNLGANYIVRDATLALGLSKSKEPDYVANSTSIDLSQEVWGGMTTIALGYTRAVDDVGARDRGFFDYAKHWKYRLGATQILSPTWLASVNLEVSSDAGYLGSPYRVARLFGAYVPEQAPRTRTGRALNFRAIGEISPGSSIRGEFRHFWDTWEVKSNTFEVGYARYFGEEYLADAYARIYSQKRALFYSDNATATTTYISRNRQLSTFNSLALGAKLSRTLGKTAGGYEIKVNGAYELIRFKFKDFTDVRSGGAYSMDANVLQLSITANF